jgi:hypothetical protein
VYLAEAGNFATDSNATGAASVNSGERSPRRPGDRAPAIADFLLSASRDKVVLVSARPPKRAREPRALPRKLTIALPLRHHLAAVNP